MRRSVRAGVPWGARGGFCARTGRSGESTLLGLWDEGGHTQPVDGPIDVDDRQHAIVRQQQSRQEPAIAVPSLTAASPRCARGLGCRHVSGRRHIGMPKHLEDGGRSLAELARMAERLSTRWKAIPRVRATSTSRCSSSRVTRRPSWKAARTMPAASRIATRTNAAPTCNAVLIGLLLAGKSDAPAVPPSTAHADQA
jgi:hypothetical protein